jgi:hypothetical protein
MNFPRLHMQLRWWRDGVDLDIDCTDMSYLAASTSR